MHKLLSRQKKKYLTKKLQNKKGFDGFFDAVEAAYHQSDTDRRLLERSMEISSKELYQANRELNAIVKAIPDNIILLDIKANILEFKTGTEIHPYFRAGRILNRNLSEIMSKDICSLFKQSIRISQEKDETVIFEFQFINTVKPFFYEARIIPLHDQLALALIRDITERKVSEEQIAYLAYHDSLTGLPNKRLFVDRLEQGIIHAKRNNKLLAVMFLDLDRFKLVNDTMGHQSGDRLLQETARRLKICIRRNGSVSRLGGDEFTIMLDEIESAQDVSRVARRIIGEFSRPLLLDSNELVISASIGISLYPVDGTDVDVLMKHADVAMYHAKEQGKNNFQFYTTELNKASIERLFLEINIRKALENNDFSVYYQPIVSGDRLEMIELEALLRWHHSELGFVPPDVFIPLVEDMGLVIDIGEWIIDQVCKQSREWIDKGFSPLPIAVNVSGKQLNDNSLIEFITEKLKKYRLTSKDISFELTESSLISDPEHVLSVLQKLQEIGIKLSLDDFGTGYSSLSYLKKFPINTLKIDKSFINDIHVEETETALVKAIIDIAHSLQMDVVAEGVETQLQLDYLCSNGCDVIQGYIFSRPVPAKDIEVMMTGEKKIND